jgi:YVTN family beta-propeller protein
MRTLRLTFHFLILAAAVIISSCTKDENKQAKGEYSNGIFIVNEGPFQNGTGTITYFNPDSNVVKQDIFEMVNGRPLGNVAQSMAQYNGKGYIVVNNAGTVEVVDLATFKSEATITNLVNPSQFLIIDAKKAYVSDWVGHVAVVDLTTNTVTKTIPSGAGPDMMVKSGNYVYVANSGGLGIDSTVTVIDFMTDLVVKEIKVGEAPSGIVADGNGKIWVSCKGIGFTGWPLPGDTPGRLVRIDPVTLSIDFDFTFNSTGDHPEKLVINKQKSILYFLCDNAIYNYNIALAATTPHKLVSRFFYSLGYQNSTGYLYASRLLDNNGNGIVVRIRAVEGTLIDSIAAGIYPRGFSFPDQE